MGTKLAAALRELGDDKVIDAVWKLVAAQGWDAAHETRREMGANLKGQWRQVTGQNYGSKRARSWQPEGYSLDLEDATKVQLDAAVLDARTAHERAIAASAVSGAERERLEQSAAEAEDLKDKLRDAEIEETRLETELEKLRGERAGMPPAGTEAPMPCPHCAKPVILRQVDLATRRLEKAEAVSEEELKARRLTIADIDGRLSGLQGQLPTQKRVVERARDAMQLALDAANRLAQMPAAAKNAEAEASAAAALDKANTRLAAWQKKREADDIAARIAGNDLVLEILAADGLRAKKLNRVLELFNAQLRPLCDAADWSVVTIDPAMTLRYGSRKYSRCSASEQYRVRAVLAVAMARIDSSGMVVLDAAEVLDGPTRSGLFAMLEESKLPALVCMTLSRRDQVPDLVAVELGTSYWIENGIARPLHALEAAA